MGKRMPLLSYPIPAAALATLLWLAALPAAAAPTGPSQMPPVLVSRCAGIAQVAVPDVAITGALATAAGTAWNSGVQGPRPPASVDRPFCRIQGTIEGSIRFELWLPMSADWNGKFLGAGVGGAAGTFNFNDLPRGVNRGYAAATTDTGHRIDDPVWMLNNPRALENYTIRANHLLPVKAKLIIAAFYARPIVRSYFIGCSGGGRQGLKELQRHPEDYDGIISGANGPHTPEMTVRRMWELIQRDAHPDLMKPADWQLIADAGAKACDVQDGVSDGPAEDPRRCHFDIASLQCRAGQNDSCLTSEQVHFAQAFYAPLRDQQGNAIDRGILPGVLIDSGRSQLAIGTFGQAIRGLPQWDGKDFDARRDLDAIDRIMPELRADDPDVSTFRHRGGKLLMYSGWMDGAVSANMVLDYYDALVARAGGPRAAAQFSRLYMLPGVQHCGGGPGADRIGGSGADAPSVDTGHDLLSALEGWVERGEAPSSLVAVKVEDGAITRRRLICPYPEHARYTGRGDPADPTDFMCAK
jgi:feruloyl esterase